MFPKMDGVIVSAIIGEILSRSISFLIEACSKRMEPPPSEPESLESLTRLLLRIGAVVEDAEGRHITNQAMLQQLRTLRHELQRGHFTLDTVRCQAHDRDKVPADGESGQNSFALSKFNPAKRLCICSDSGDRSRDLQRVIASLEASLQNAAEFILLSGRYPRLARQPYSMYLLMDKCMFGRQIEMELIMKFLLQGEQDPGDEHLGVLPIVGPANVGKSTLVEHACIDERARNHFSQIVLLSGGDLNDKEMEALADGAGVIKHENQAELGAGRVALIIVELDRDISDEFWLRLYSTLKIRFAHGSKIIVTSRSDKIVGFGTTIPIRLQFLTQEAYWYFFKVRNFGSVDVVMEHPKLASIAMEMAREMSGCFMGATIFGGMLRSRLDIGTWSLALATYREFRQRNRFISCQNPVDPWALSRPLLLPTVNRVSPGYFVVVKGYQTASTHGDGTAPKISVQDVILGRARPQGKFPALAWRSHIPPHYNYVFSCEQRMQTSVVSKKRKTQKVSV